ncbi:MAG: hypothetical protein J1F36_01745 [Clostridiales bacterium]|nr:hypothetical protein [Clostridiales bacterium]
MRKFTALLLIALLMFLCVGCGPYRDYAGTYTKKMSSATLTITLSASGAFEFERKPTSSSEYTPIETIYGEGTFTVKNEKITIEYSYYEVALGERVNRVATAKLNGNKLVISGTELAGSYTKNKI